MFRTRIGGSGYVFVFITLLLCLKFWWAPLIVIDWLTLPVEAQASRIAVWVLVGFINLVALGLVWTRCRTDEVNFIQTLQVVAGGFMSGCANITILYIFFVLFAYYVWALILAIVGLFNDPTWTQERWFRLVLGTARRTQAG